MAQQRGTVKWFSDQKGYGFITPVTGEKDIFVHFSKVNMDGYKKLSEGDVVQFEVEDSPKGLQAANVSIVQ